MDKRNQDDEQRNKERDRDHQKFMDKRNQDDEQRNKDHQDRIKEIEDRKNRNIAASKEKFRQQQEASAKIIKDAEEKYEREKALRDAKFEAKQGALKAEQEKQKVAYEAFMKATEQ